MARLTLAAAMFAAACAQGRQGDADRQLKEAGVCARCHVISVVEWGMSKHWRAGANCVACHGSSEGHVADERNNIKPERTPREEAIAALCLDCHPKNRPKTPRTAKCQTCHHVHALVNPSAPPRAPEPVAAEQRPAPAAPADPVAGLPREVRAAGVGIRLVLIPGGELTLGSDDLLKSRPAHTVGVKPFYLAVNEVTESQWRSVTGMEPADAASAGLPAARISWHDAQAFLEKLNAKVPGGGFRLPSEAEWEFAARAGGGAGGAFEMSGPRPVGKGRPNRFGIYDLLGNVWEWCSTLDRPYPYQPGDGRESLSAPGLRILRGGGYFDVPEWIGPALRHSERPGRRLPWVGFRIARDAR